MHSRNRNIWGIIPCAGVGTRFGGGVPKQYELLNNSPIVLHALDRLSRVKGLLGIGVGVARDDLRWAQLGGDLPGSPWHFTGGVTRAQTVRLGLEELEQRGEGDAWVLVHDAARPCVRTQDIERLIDEVAFDPSGGFLGTPLADTLKSVGQDSRVTQTVSREGFWRAQTPQFFPIRTLIQGMDHCHEEGIICTDDAQAIESLGLHPRAVYCGDYNFKITQRSDLGIAQMILDEQEGMECIG